jgi:hypothetical protein
MGTEINQDQAIPDMTQVTVTAMEMTMAMTTKMATETVTVMEMERVVETGKATVKSPDF